MAREARVVAEGVPHHITQRGNNRQNVFLLDEDRRYYIETLRATSRQHGLTILGYCLMTNHVHLIAIPKRENSMAKAIGRAHWNYTMRFNKNNGAAGTLVAEPLLFVSFRALALGCGIGLCRSESGTCGDGRGRNSLPMVECGGAFRKCRERPSDRRRGVGPGGLGAGLGAAIVVRVGRCPRRGVEASNVLRPAIRR